MVEHSDQVLAALRKVPGFENLDDVIANAGKYWSVKGRKKGAVSH